MPLQSSRTVTSPHAPHRRFVEPVRTPHAAEPVRSPGLYAGEPETCRRSMRQFLCIAAHLALILAVLEVYRIDWRALRVVMCTALIALPIHYWLPFRWKQPVLIFASLAAMTLVFGIVVAAVAAGLTIALVAIASLPLRWEFRAALVACAGLLFGLSRTGVVALPVPSLVWPVLGTLCMFRMIIYLYEMKHAKQAERWDDVLSYFFLLPNFAFHLFPVVDYRTLRRGYFATEIHATQRRGLRLIVRGAVHLLLYRLVYHKLLPEEVYDPTTLAAFIVCNYLLYLQVSGLFHMACGLMHLFGYELPDTHHHYLLATSFTDYWRRINIYWKDFMVKLVFNPVAFRVKHWSRAAGLSLATGAVFVATWLLHGYQAFWLRGTWGFRATDGLFWGILGVFVIINVQVDARSNRARRLRGAQFSFRSLATRSLKTAATFLTIAVLWSLWDSPSVGAWFDMIGRAFG